MNWGGCTGITTRLPTDGIVVCAGNTTMIHLLYGLDAANIKLIVGCASNIRFNAGDYIFREDQEADQFYIIRQGTIALEIYTPDRGPIIIDMLEAGDVLGWSWLVPPYQWRFDAKAKAWNSMK